MFQIFSLPPSCFPSKTLYIRVLSLIHARFSVVLAFLHLIAREIAGEDYSSWSSLFCNLVHSSVTSSYLGPSVSFSNLFSDILRACSFLSVRPSLMPLMNNNRQNYSSMYFDFTILDNKLEDRSFWTEFLTSMLWIQFILNFLRMKLWLFRVIPKYLNLFI